MLPDLANPETALALAYVPVARRDAMHALFALDDRLAEIVATTREPALGEIRLAWWREALEALDTRPPPAEPLLRSIAAALLPLGISGAALATIEEGWAAILGPDPAASEALRRHAACRGGTLFTLAGRVLAADTPSWLRRSGEGWALADVSIRLNPPAAEEALRLARDRLAVRPRWPVALRPLGMLAMLARRDAIHPGRRRQASPFRMFRMLAHSITG